MRIELSGKTALVTASTAGIGFATAKGLAESGATVVLNGRSDASVAKAREKLLAAVPNAQLLGIAADLSDSAGADKLLAALPSVDILVNNAGIYEQQDFFESDDALWEQHWQTNVMSGVRLSRALLPQLMAKGWGRVVFISSESAFNIPVEMIHYGFSKTAQVTIARGLAERMAGTNVTVNSVLPGPTLSEGLAEMLRPEQEKTGKTMEEVAAEFVMQHRPSSIIRRAASVDEVANMVVYLSSPQASATTGAAVRVDGGVLSTI